MNYYKQIGKYKYVSEIIWTTYIAALLVSYSLYYIFDDKGFSGEILLTFIIPASIIIILEFKRNKLKAEFFKQYEQTILAETKEESMGSIKKDYFLYGKAWTQRKKLNKFYRANQELSNDEYISYLIAEYNANKT